MSTTVTATGDRISLVGLSARGHHGVLPFEREEGQLFTVDVTLDLGPRGTAVAAVTDSLDDAVDYATVATAVVTIIEGEPVGLLESLADRIAEKVLSYSRVRAAEITVHKPQAPLDVAFEDVAVTIHRVSDAAQSSEPAESAAAPAAEPAEPEARRHTSHRAQSPDEHLSGAAGATGAAGIAASTTWGSQAWADDSQDSADSVDSAQASDALSAPDLLSAQPASQSPLRAEPEPVTDSAAPDLGDQDEDADHLLEDALMAAVQADDEPGYPDFGAAEQEAAVGGPSPVVDDSEGWVTQDSVADAAAPAAPIDSLPAGLPIQLPGEGRHRAETGIGSPQDSYLDQQEGLPGLPDAAGDEAAAAGLGGESAASAALLDPTAHTADSAEPADSARPAGSAGSADDPGAFLAQAPVTDAPEEAREDQSAPVVAAQAVDPLDQRPGRPVGAVIALGANAGHVLVNLRNAVRSLQGAEGLEVLQVGPLARTVAEVLPDAEPQPDYLNTVVTALTTLTPRELLALCQQLEAEAGRVRTTQWAPRTLDVDVISVEGVTSHDPELSLPHPRAHERAFVLVPWAQADPFADLDGRAVAELADEAPGRDGLRWLAFDWLDTDNIPDKPTGPYVAPPVLEEDPEPMEVVYEATRNERSVADAELAAEYLGGVGGLGSDPQAGHAIQAVQSAEPRSAAAQPDLPSEPQAEGPGAAQGLDNPFAAASFGTDYAVPVDQAEQVEQPEQVGQGEQLDLGQHSPFHVPGQAPPAGAEDSWDAPLQWNDVIGGGPGSGPRQGS